MYYQIILYIQLIIFSWKKDPFCLDYYKFCDLKLFFIFIITLDILEGSSRGTVLKILMK